MFRLFKRRMIAAGLLCLTFGGPPLAHGAEANLEAFVECDGYGAPSASGDGMSKRANTLGFFVPAYGYGTTLQDEVRLGPLGVAACDEALASSKLQSRFWQRRVSLLRARAVHLMAMGNLPEAERGLAAAVTAAGNGDPFYDRSMGLGFDFLRAYLKRQEGDVAGSSALALEAWRKRPFSRSAAVSAIIAMGPDADFKDVEAVLGPISRQFPDLAEFYFLELFERGRFEDAVKLYVVLWPRDRASNMETFLTGIERTDGLVGFFKKDAAEEEASLRVSGMQAYMLAALGREGEAQAALTFARDRFEANTKPLPPAPLGANGKPKRQLARPLVEAWHRRLSLQASDLERWTMLVAVRQRVGVAPETVEAFLTSGPIPLSRASLDILDAALAKSLEPALKARVLAERNRLAEALAKEHRAVWTASTDLARLFAALPDAETSGRFQGYKGPKPLPARGHFPYPETGSEVFEYWGYESTAAMTQEAVLLQVAEYARQKKQRGFIILRRDDFQEMTQTVTYGVVSGDPRLTGYRSTVLVVLVDPERLPEAFASDGWRVIDADAVYAALNPVYGAKARAR